MADIYVRVVLIAKDGVLELKYDVEEEEEEQVSGGWP